MKQGCYSRYCLRVQSFRYLFPIFISRNDFSPKNRHRERIVGWVGKYSILSIQFSRKMTRPPFLEGPRRSFSQILSLELECATKRGRGGGREGGLKEKNKFDQSEGGGYRFGYGFRKRRRILFLRKPDKGPFTRIFLHTRRLHLSSSLYTIYASTKEKERWKYHKCIILFIPYRIISFLFHIFNLFSLKKMFIEFKIFKNFYVSIINLTFKRKKLKSIEFSRIQISSKNCSDDERWY